jgi:hypothetical protein
MKKALAKRAVDVQNQLIDDYGLTADEAATLTKVSFYDIFFLCGETKLPFMYFCLF